MPSIRAWREVAKTALNRIAMESIEPLMNMSTEEISINDYQELISEIDKKEKKITKGLEAELVFFGTLGFGKLLKDNWKGLYGFFGISDQESEKWLLMFYSYIARPILKPVLKQDYAFYVRCLTEVIELSNLPYYQVKDRLSELEKNLGIAGQVMKYPLSSIMFPALSRANIRQAKHNAQLDGLKIACAFKIYKKNNGSYPDNLTTLIPDIIGELPLDPFTGKDFIYRKEGEGFIVYSLGPNEKNDNGISQKENNEMQKEKGFQSRDNDAYDIVWKCKE